MKRRLVVNRNGVLVETEKWITKCGELFGFLGNINRRCSDKTLFKKKYIGNTITAKKNYRHALVANCFCVNPRPGYFTEIDHKDGNTLNNHADNLRHVSRRLNQLNQKSKYRSASTRNSINPYSAQIKFYSHCRYLGAYKTEKEACDIMDKIRQELFDKLYDYETRPMCYMPPEIWRVTKYGVDVM